MRAIITSAAPLRLVLASALLTLVTAGAAPASAAVFSARDATSFAAFARSHPGPVGVSVVPVGRGGHVEHLGALDSAIAWSTSKVPVAMAVIASGHGTAQSANLRAAITASDNAAAERLWASLGSGQKAASAADRQLRAAGDTRTHVQSRRLRSAFTPFGQTVWRLDDQARFTAGMRCTTPGRRVLGLMGQVIAAHRWGLGAVRASAQLKGGWGPGHEPGVDGGYLDRQMGVVTVRGHRLAVAIASLPRDGSHETGTRNLTALARWVVAHVEVRNIPKSSGC